MPGGEARNSQEICIGSVSGVFGVRGEVRLFLHNRESRFLFKRREVVLCSPDGERREVTLKAREGAGRRVLARASGVDSPEDARALMGWEILVPEDALPPLDEHEWYHHELLGLEVQTEEGELLGELVEIHQTAPVDVWEVRGESLHYIPVLIETIVGLEDDVLIVKGEGVKTADL